jgi:hypothetical protein
MTVTEQVVMVLSPPCSGVPDLSERINTMTQFLDHLTNDAMPALIDRLAAGKGMA